MGRKSRIRQLPPAIREEVDRLLLDGRHSLNDILNHLRALGAQPPSRSALGRYAQNFETVAARLRESREMAKALAQSLGPESTEGEQGRILIENVRTLVFDVLQTKLLLEQGKEVDPKDVVMLAKSVRELAQAQRMELEFAQRIREETRRELREKLRKGLGSAQELKELSDEELAERIARLTAE